MTHYVPPFTEGKGCYQRSVCGAVIDTLRYHSAEPTCSKCAAWLEADATETAALEAAWQREDDAKRQGNGGVPERFMRDDALNNS